MIGKDLPRAAVCTVFDGAKRRLRLELLILAGCLLASSDGHTQRANEGSGLSKAMRIAIGYYEKGEDLESMDHFMQILVKGSPVERPMANQYLNLISERMALGGKFDKKPPPGVEVIEEGGPAKIEEVAPVPETSKAPSPSEDAVIVETVDPKYPLAAPRERRVRRKASKLTKQDRALMKTEIEAKIRNRTRVLLGKLRRYEEIRVLMANSRLPRGIGVPADLLFSQGTQFKKDSANILETLTHLIFSLGATQVVILPENAVLGDAKIIDLRRTMGVSSYLIKAGVAPARVRVNLLSSQVEVPNGLQDFRGVLLLFVYNQPLRLGSDGVVDAESGPPLSLGVSPAEVDVKKDEGAIIEFSVMEPPVGLMSWRFQLLGPGSSKGDDMAPLQEVKGAAPVFHQIFWNGQKQYFGDALPGGRYECVLAATDMRNRTRKRRAWITVLGPEAEAAPAPAPEPVKAADKPQLPPAELEQDDEDEPRKRPSVTIDKRRTSASAKRRAERKRRRRSKRAAAKKQGNITVATIKTPDKDAGKTEASEKSAQSGSTRARAVNYQVLFVKNTSNITPDGESILSLVTDTMHEYPLDNINLVGYAYSGERDSQSLASRRADTVSRLLIERHGMKRERIQVQTKIMERESHKVEIYIVSGGS